MLGRSDYYFLPDLHLFGIFSTKSLLNQLANVLTIFLLNRLSFFARAEDDSYYENLGPSPFRG